MAKHKHCWKYIFGGKVRICEAPFPTIESCGKKEWLRHPNYWVDENECGNEIEKLRD